MLYYILIVTYIYLFIHIFIYLFMVKCGFGAFVFERVLGKPALFFLLRICCITHPACLHILNRKKTTIGCSTCMPATHGTPATRTGKKTWRFQNSPVQLYHPRAARVVVFAGPALCASTVVLPVGLCPGSRGLTLRSDIRAAGFVGAGPALACPRRRRSPACGKRCMANKGIVRADVTLYI